MMTELSRRIFLSTVGAGTAAMATGSLFAAESGIGSVMPTKGQVTERPLPTNEPSKSGHYRPPYRFGLGGVAIGNGFAPVADEAAYATLEAAWAAGVRYFDTSPWYSLGPYSHVTITSGLVLSETHPNHILRGSPGCYNRCNDHGEA